VLVNRLRRIADRVDRAARRHESSRLDVLKRAIWLRVHRRMGLEEAFFAGALDPQVPAVRTDELVTRDEFLRTLRPFNAELKELVDDKAVFYLYAQSHGLPIPRTLALINSPFAVTSEGRPLHRERDWLRWSREELPDAFVVKPSVGMGGRGLDVYERRAGDLWCGNARLSDEQLRQRVCVEARYGRAVIQARLKNHAALVQLSGKSALQCTRMVTVVTPSGEVEILVAFQKLIVGDNLIDNSVGTWTGNLVVCVDVATGTLGAGFADGAPCVVHPDTGRTLAGFGLPRWSEACALVRRAALRFRPLRAIGWDVALTDDGPILVEGNTEWLAFGAAGFWYGSADLARLKRLF
jgi:hypothetical protein